jgi:hypothetical protein
MPPLCKKKKIEFRFSRYAALKKTIYELEGGLGSRNDGASYGERSSLLASGDQSASTNEKFIPLLDRELAKTVNFYKAQEPELRAEIEDVAANIARREEEGLGPDPRYVDDDESDDDDVSNLGSGSSPHAARRRRRTLSANYSSLGKYLYGIYLLIVVNARLPSPRTPAARAGRPRSELRDLLARREP